MWTWSVFLVLGASLTVASPVVSPDSGEARVANLRRAWEDCTTLVHEKPCAPIIVRLAWHEAGTYDAKLKNGGAIGTIIYPSELRHPNDAGLDGAVELLRPLHAANPEVSWAVSLLLLLAVVLASDLALLLAGGRAAPGPLCGPAHAPRPRHWLRNRDQHCPCLPDVHHHQPGHRQPVHVSHRAPPVMRSCPRRVPQLQVLQPR